MDVSARLPAKQTSIHAVVTRKDGTVENLGLISYWHRNPIINWVVNAYIRLKDFINDRSRPK